MRLFGKKKEEKKVVKVKRYRFTLHLVDGTEKSWEDDIAEVEFGRGITMSPNTIAKGRLRDMLERGFSTRTGDYGLRAYPPHQIEWVEVEGLTPDPEPEGKE